MKDIKRLTLKEEAAKEVQQIEEEVLTKEELSSIEVTPEMDRKMEEMILKYEKLKEKRKIEYMGGSVKWDTDEEMEDTYEEVEEFDNLTDFMDAAERYLSEEDREALAIGRKMLEKEYNKEQKRLKKAPKKKKLWVALVAIMVLLMAVGITSVGSKSYWKELWSRMLGEQENTVINVEDADVMESEDGEIRECFMNIERQLGIRVVRPRMIPKEMHLLEYELDEEQRIAKVFYEYESKTILYGIYANDMDSSYTEKVEDEHTDTFEVDNGKQIIVVEEYYVEDSQEYRYVTNFEYQGIQYRMKGIMDRAEFVEILKNLYYF